MANILVVSHRVPFPPNKGEKLRTFYQIEALVNHGHSVTVAAPIESEQDKEHVLALAKRLSIAVHTFKLPHKILRIARALFKNESISSANFYAKDLSAFLLRHVEDFDIVYTCASSLNSYIFQLKLHQKAICMSDFMDVDSDKWRQYAKNANVLMRYVYSREAKLISELEDKSVAYLARCFVIAQEEKRILESQTKDTLADKHSNIGVLGNGVDVSEFAHCPNKANHIIELVFVGVMDYKPNVESVHWFVDNCWARVKDAVPNARFTIAGMNPVPSIQRLEKLDGIEVTGFVDDIMPYFDRAHIFVAPFQTARGVQNKVLQAMSCGLAVVSTKLGIEGIFHETDKDVIIADSIDDFSSALIQLSQDDARRQTLGKCANERIVNEYSWEAALKPLLSAVSLASVQEEHDVS
ncbi:glycosyltransferase [Ningiella sp. W23]|uniref:glycosyltransferase n=1 Tax=Ningiella sp. W23 TaxID=3023715 RepID=UPI003757EE41